MPSPGVGARLRRAPADPGLRRRRGRLPAADAGLQQPEQEASRPSLTNLEQFGGPHPSEAGQGPNPECVIRRWTGLPDGFRNPLGGGVLHPAVLAEVSSRWDGWLGAGALPARHLPLFWALSRARRALRLPSSSLFAKRKACFAHRSSDRHGAPSDARQSGCALSPDCALSLTKGLVMRPELDEEPPQSARERARAIRVRTPTPVPPAET